MSDTDFMIGIKKIIKDSIKNNIDIYIVTAYKTETNNIVARKLYEKNSREYIIQSGIGLGNNKGIVSGYEVGDVLVCVEINGMLIVLTTLYNNFFSDKDVTLVPTEKEYILKSAGSIKIFNKDNYGIEITEDGNIIIYGKSIDFKNTTGDL